MAEGWKLGGLLRGNAIPAPSGKYKVGCVDLMLDLVGDQLQGGLLVRLHYPTNASPGTTADSYKYASWFPNKTYVKGYLDYTKTKFSGILSNVISMLIAAMVPALMEAPLLKTESCVDETTPKATPIFPVIVFSHGIGSMRTCYSAICCDFASHGYVVVVVEHRDQSACVALQRVAKPGGKEGELQDQWLQFRHLEVGEDEFPLRNKQVKQRVDDVRRSLDILCLLNEGSAVSNLLGGSYNFSQFKGCMDMSRVALVGHSYGGGTIIKTLLEDSRFKCGLALDCWMLPLYKNVEDAVGVTVSQPLYFINSYDFQWKQNIQKIMSLSRSPDASGRTTCRVLTLKETNHFNQCDIPFVIPRLFPRFGMPRSRLDPVLAHQINMDICHAFLKRHLLHDPTCEGVVPNLDGSEGHSPHILFGTNLDLMEKNASSSPATDIAGVEGNTGADDGGDSGGCSGDIGGGEEATS